MKKLTIVFALLVTAATAMAQNGFALHGKGRGAGIGDVVIEAAKVGDTVRGNFGAVVRTGSGELAVRGKVTRLAPDGTRPRVFNFRAECKDAAGKVYVVEGSCVDGATTERDDILFTIADRAGTVFRGTTDRQIVTVRRLHRG